MCVEMNRVVVVGVLIYEKNFILYTFNHRERTIRTLKMIKYQSSIMKTVRVTEI